jgi:flagellin-like hook-associated protein FlgL
MELTNHSAIDIFGQFSATQPELARSRQRLGTGKRITRSSDDPGATAIAMESTRLARPNVKMETLNRLLSTATRMTDVLIPLAAQRPGGA